MIRFHSEEIPFPAIEKQKTKNWIKEVIIAEGKAVGEINIIFCSDEYLLNINREYLKHNYFTDVITFDYSENKSIVGDVFISIERIKDNAKQLKINYKQELRRVIVHGTLHLLGYKDKQDSEKAEMTRKENFYLNFISNE